MPLAARLKLGGVAGGKISETKPKDDVESMGQIFACSNTEPYRAPGTEPELPKIT